MLRRERGAAGARRAPSRSASVLARRARAPRRDSRCRVGGRDEGLSDSVKGCARKRSNGDLRTERAPTQERRFRERDSGTSQRILRGRGETNGIDQRLKDPQRRKQLLKASEVNGHEGGRKGSLPGVDAEGQGDCAAGTTLQGPRCRNPGTARTWTAARTAPQGPRCRDRAHGPRAQNKPARSGRAGGNSRGNSSGEHITGPRLANGPAKSRDESATRQGRIRRGC